MKRLVLLCLLPTVALGYVKISDFSSKTTTLPADADACTTAGDTDCTTFGLCDGATTGGLCPSSGATWHIGGFSNFTLTVNNTSVVTHKDILILMSDDNSNWEVWDSTTFDELLTLQVRSISVSGSSRRYVRIQGNSTTGGAVVASISANDG